MLSPKLFGSRSFLTQESNPQSGNWCCWGAGPWPGTPPLRISAPHLCNERLEAAQGPSSSWSRSLRFAGTFTRGGSLLETQRGIPNKATWEGGRAGGQPSSALPSSGWWGGAQGRGGGALRRRAHTLWLSRPCPALHLPSSSGQRGAPAAAAGGLQTVSRQCGGVFGGPGGGPGGGLGGSPQSSSFP